MNKFKRWYEKNKEKYNQERKKKYDNDEEYRDRQLENNKKYREENKAENDDSFIFDIGGQQVSVVLYTSHDLAKRLDCSITAIRKWEQKGVIPETPLKDAKNVRYYTNEYINLIENILKAKGILKNNAAKLFKGINYLCINHDKNMLQEKIFFTENALCQQLGITKEEYEDVYKNHSFPKPKTINNNGELLYTQRMINYFGKNIKKIPDAITREQKNTLHRYVGQAWIKEGNLTLVKPFPKI